jgi:hypothetical protein
MFFSPEAIRRALNSQSSSTDLASASSSNQRPSPPAISHLSSSADLLSASSSSNQRPSPPPASILVNNLHADGFDARSKLKILLRLAYGIDVKEEEASDNKRKLQKHLKNPSSKGEEGTLPDHVSSDSLVKEGAKAILLQSVIIHTPTLSRRNKKLLSSAEDGRKL